LAEAGLEDGFDTMLLMTGHFPAGISIAEVVQSQLEEIGVRAEIRTLDWALYRNTGLTNKEKIPAMIGWQWGADFPDPDEVLMYMYGCAGVEFSASMHCNEQFDELVTAARFEQDQDKRRQLY